MSIWKQEFTIEGLNDLCQGNMGEHLGIRVIAFGPDKVWASMPVDERTRQPVGLLHGGASVALAETLGSVASTLCLKDLGQKTAVGIEINANHLKSVRSGKVFGCVYPIRLGRSIHVWQIDIYNERGQQTCSSRLTTAIVDLKH